MSLNQLLFTAVLIATIGLAGCSQQSAYDRMVERELATGVRNDSMFLGIYLGMTNQDFFAHCWEMNKKQMIKQGPANESVQFEIQGKDDVIYLNFYPEFHDLRIYEMNMTLNYRSWSPWNHQFSSDSLQQEILPIFEDWFGPGFLEISHPKRGKLYVKVDGNRRVMFYREDNWKLKAKITDLPVANAIEENEKKNAASGS